MNLAYGRSYFLASPVIDRVRISGRDAASRVSIWLLLSLAWAGSLAGLPASAAASNGADRSFYVDANLGSDDNTGALDKPWKTLQRAQRTALKAGDTLLLKCDGLWRESLTIDAALAPLGNITVRPYGACPEDRQPTISGADVIASGRWSLDPETPNLYFKNVTQPVSQVLVKGMPLVLARYPNYGGIGREFRLVASNLPGISNGFVAADADRAALAGQDLVDATVYVKSSPWMIESRRVSSFDSRTGALLFKIKSAKWDKQDAMDNAVKPGAGYILEGKKWMLDSRDEWFFDAKTMRVFLWSAAGPPPEDAIEIVTRDVGISIKSLNGIRIEKIAVVNFESAGIQANNSKDVQVDGVLLNQNFHLGISMEGGTGHRVANSHVTSTGKTGIRVLASSSSVLSNSIDKTGISGLARSTDGAIYAVGSNILISKNVISKSGFHGITLGGPQGGEISLNTVDMPCMRFGDCGGIYFGGRLQRSKRTTIRENSISDTKINDEGSTGTNSIAGIYLDEGGGDADVTLNAVSKTDYGVFIHKGSNISIQTNTVWAVRTTCIFIQNSGELLRGNTISGNYLFVGSQSPRVLSVQLRFASATASTGLDAFLSGPNANRFGGNVVAVNSEGTKPKWTLVSGQATEEFDVSRWTKYEPGVRMQSRQEAASDVEKLISNRKITAKLRAEM